MPLRTLTAASASAALLLLIAVVPAFAASHHHRRTAACRHANTPSTRAPRAEIRAAVVCLVNRERREYGLPALRVSRRLNRSAQGWTNWMVRSRDFLHGAYTARIAAVGLHPSAEGENIATGFITARQVVDGWMHSAGHCRNILDPDYLLIGTGLVDHVVPGARRGAATWTQDFGTPSGVWSRSRDWRPADTVC